MAESTEVATQYAGFWLRLLASLIDSVMLTVLILPILLHLYGFKIFVNKDLLHSPLAMFIQYGIPAIIIVVFWFYRSATPGKMMLDIIIVREQDGLKPTTAQTIVRYFGYYISLLGLGFGFFWIMWDRKKQGWHDKIAKTVVIKKTSPDSR